MSWGYKIAGAYLVFVAGIVFLVYKSSTQKVDLVTSNYYEQELMYQHKIDEAARAATLTGGLVCEITDGKLSVVLPNEMASAKVDAEVLLYCPSDSKKDISRNMQTGSGRLEMDIPREYKGQFEVKVNWQAEGKAYFATQKLFIQ